MKSIALVCAHNGEPYIFAQLASIASQSKPISRIVVFDFDSADQTVKEVERFMGVHDAVDVQLVKKNFALGPCHSFLTAMREIEGAVDDECLLYLCDQDDCWMHSKNEAITALAVEAGKMVPCYLIHHDVAVTDENLVTTQATFYDEDFKSLLSRRGVYLSLSFNTTIGHTIAVSPGLMRMMNVLQVDRGLIMHDWAISILAELVGRRFFVPQQLSLYRQHATNAIGYKNSGGDGLIAKLRNVVRLTRRIAAQGGLIVAEVRSRPGEPGADRSCKSNVGAVGWLTRQYTRNMMFAPSARLRIAGCLVLFWHCISLARQAIRR
jgi:glycosyltransferase involved in cell wall biosynthesis